MSILRLRLLRTFSWSVPSLTNREQNPWYYNYSVLLARWLARSLDGWLRTPDVACSPAGRVLVAIRPWLAVGRTVVPA